MDKDIQWAAYVGMCKPERKMIIIKKKQIKNDTRIHFAKSNSKSLLTCPRGYIYITNQLNSAEHEICHAHKG